MSGTSAPFVICGAVVSAPEYGKLMVFRSRAVAVDSTGTIAEVAPDTEVERLCSLVGCSKNEVLRIPEGHVLCPGFIDIHIHAPQYTYTGTATDRPLMEWLEHYTFPAEAAVNENPSTAARDAYSSVVAATLAHGTTTALYFATTGEEACNTLVEVLEEAGQRALVGKVCQDRHSPDGVAETTEESLARTERFIVNVNASSGGKAERLRPVITPRFVPTCTPRLLNGLGALAAKYCAHVTSHISESVDQVEFVEQLHPGRRDTEIFKEAGLLTSKTVMAHGTQLREDELRSLASAGTAIAHCPLSNFFFGHGLLSVEQCRMLGVKVGLATDVAGGYSPSMLSAIRNAVITNKVLKMPMMAAAERSFNDSGVFDYRHAFWLATAGSAEALSMQDSIGSLEAGKKFDCIQVMLSAVAGSQQQHKVCPRDALEICLEKWINLGDDREIVHVWVDGRPVKHHHRLS